MREDIEELVEVLHQKSGVPKEEVRKRVREKLEEFSGLVTEEGAVLLVAKELGVEMLERIRRRLEIKNIVPGMKRVCFVGRIFKVGPVVEFEKQGVSGRVVNLYVGDSTGYVRLPLWNDQVGLVEEGLLKVGDVVQVTRAVARENIFGETEVLLGRYGSVRTVEDESVEAELPAAQELLRKYLQAVPERKNIEDLKPGRVEIRGWVVHVFRGNFIFEVCPFCNLAVTDSTCEEHGAVRPEAALVVSCIVDDGTSNIKAVFFREVAEKFTGLSAKEIKDLSKEERYERVSGAILGKEAVLVGNVKRNKLFGNLEFLVNEVKEVDWEEEAERILGRIEQEYHI